MARSEEVRQELPPSTQGQLQYRTHVSRISSAYIENVYWAHIEAYIETCWQDVWKSFARIISNIGTEYIAHTLPPTQKPAVSNMYKKICQIILNFQYLKDHTRKLFFQNILDGGQCVQYWDRPVSAGVEAWRCPPPRRHNSAVDCYRVSHISPEKLKTLKMVTIFSAVIWFCL